MTALQIADIKGFMQKLLLSETFDHFLLLEGSVTTFNTFRIDGALQKSYYTPDEQEQLTGRRLSYWSEVRPFCLSLIRGKRTPVAFHFTFRLSDSNTEKLLRQTGVNIPAEQVQGLFLNVRYLGQALTCTTGVSLSVFTPDKKTDHAWDDMVRRFFRQQGIPFETVS